MTPILDWGTPAWWSSLDLGDSLPFVSVNGTVHCRNINADWLCYCCSFWPCGFRIGWASSNCWFSVYKFDLCDQFFLGPISQTWCWNRRCRTYEFRPLYMQVFACKLCVISSWSLLIWRTSARTGWSNVLHGKSYLQRHSCHLSSGHHCVRLNWMPYS